MLMLHYFMFHYFNIVLLFIVLRLSMFQMPNFLLKFYVSFLKNARFYVAIIKDSFLFSSPKEFHYQLVHFETVW